MKQILSLAIVCGAYISLNAQITITTTDMPASNDSAYYSNIATSTSFDYESTGANYTWDFSGLTYTDQTVVKYQPGNTTAYSATFGAGTYGTKILDTLIVSGYTLTNIYDFFTNSAGSFNATGRGVMYGASPITGTYSNPDEVYTFPLDYLDNDTTTYKYSMTVMGMAEVRENGTRANVVEGWGTIITPYQSYSCLKVRTSTYGTDSIFVMGMYNTRVVFNRREYKWLVIGQDIPVVFEIFGNVAGSVFTPIRIRYQDIYHAPTGLVQTAAQSNVMVYPNPAQNNVNVLTSAQSGTISITDLSGRVLHTQTINNSLSTIDIQNYATGMYIMNVNTDSGNTTQKFFKE